MAAPMPDIVAAPQAAPAPQMPAILQALSGAGGGMQQPMQNPMEQRQVAMMDNLINRLSQPRQAFKPQIGDILNALSNAKAGVPYGKSMMQAQEMQQQAESSELNRAVQVGNLIQSRMELAAKSGDRGARTLKDALELLGAGEMSIEDRMRLISEVPKLGLNGSMSLPQVIEKLQPLASQFKVTSEPLQSTTKMTLGGKEVLVGVTKSGKTRVLSQGDVEDTFDVKEVGTDPEGNKQFQSFSKKTGQPVGTPYTGGSANIDQYSNVRTVVGADGREELHGFNKVTRQFEKIVQGGKKPTVPAYEPAGDKLAVEQFGKIAGDNTAEALLSNFRRLQAMGPVPTGPLEQWLAPLRGYAKDLGINIPITNAAEGQQAFSAIASGMLLQFANNPDTQLKGSFSDRDIAFLRATGPSLLNLPGANKMIIDWGIQSAQRAIELKRDTVNWYTANNGNPRGIYKFLQDWKDKKGDLIPQFPADMKWEAPLSTGGILTYPVYREVMRGKGASENEVLEGWQKKIGQGSKTETAPSATPAPPPPAPTPAAPPPPPAPNPPATPQTGGKLTPAEMEEWQRLTKLKGDQLSFEQRVRGAELTRKMLQ
jgi:hypothetical protein